MRSSPLARALPFVLLVGTAWAVDHPIGGDRLLLRDGPNAGKRRLSFKATADPAIDRRIRSTTPAT